MAFLTKVRFEAEGDDPGEVLQLIDRAVKAAASAASDGPEYNEGHVTDEVYERVAPGSTSADGRGRYKGRRVVAFVDRDEPKTITHPAPYFIPCTTSGATVSSSVRTSG